MKLFNKGDRVRLTQSIGKFPAGTEGVVEEVYEFGLAGKEADMDALFDYALRIEGQDTPVRESELEQGVPGVDPKPFVLIPRNVLAVRWDANTGHEGAKALAKWVGGKFDFDPMHPEKTYYWSIEVSHRSGYFLRIRPGKWALKHANGDIRAMNPDAFASTYTKLEK